MNIVRVIWKEHPVRLCIAIGACLMHTLLNVTLLGIISFYTSQRRVPPIPWWAFLLLICATVGVQTLSIRISDGIAQSVAGRMRRRLLDRIAAANLNSIEQLGPSSLIMAFMDDVQRVSVAIPMAVNLVRDVGFIVGIMVYLLWFSPKMMGLLTIALVVGFIVFYRMRALGIKNAILTHKISEKMFGSYRHLIEGVKQLKVSGLLEQSVLEQLERCNQENQLYALRTSTSFNLGTNSGVLLYFSVLLAFSYLRIDESASGQVVSLYVIAVVLLLSPLLSLSSSIQHLTIARVALARTERILGALGHVAGNRKAAITQAITHDRIGQGRSSHSVATLEFRNVTHTYQGEHRQEFVLGPVSFEVKAGESLFIVGGNGTGKTTLVKLITALYAPTSGELVIDGQVIGEPDRAWLRTRFAVVFGDSCLFESLAGSPFDEEASRIGVERLEHLRLTHAIDSARSLLAQAGSCSSGERRRVAYLLAALDDRPIYVFDEFAADQDPESKDWFYRVLIPELKARGKIVIVVTHDDRYFEYANSILELDRGLLPRVRRAGEQAAIGVQIKTPAFRLA